VLRQLADGGGLAHAVDADHHQHEGLGSAAEFERHGDRPQQAHQVLAQRAQQRRRILELARLHAPAQILDQLRGGGDAHVGAEQHGLEFLQQGVVEARVGREQGGERAAQCVAAQAFAPAGGGRGGRRRGRGRLGRRRRGFARGRFALPELEHCASR